MEGFEIGVIFVDFYCYCLSPDADTSNDPTSGLALSLDDTTSVLTMEPDVERLMAIHGVTADMIEGEQEKKTKSGSVT